MNKLPLLTVGVVCAAGVVAGTIGFAATSLQAASATASMGATISSSGSVGTPPDPTPVPAPVTTPVVTTTSTGNPTTPTGSTIRSVPVSTTSNVGFNSPAPVAATSPAAAEAEAQAAAATSSTATPAATAQAFSSRGAAPIALGASAAVAVAGAPNQTYTVILPGNTAYSNGGEVVSLSDFQHNAGTTPALGRNGAGVFTIGAKSDKTPSTETTPAQPGQENAVSSAFTNRSPTVNVSVTYN